MTIFITGDTHGRLDLDKLFGMNFDSRGLTKNDYVIICGDFALVWQPQGGDYSSEKRRANHEATLDWLDSKPWTTLFIDGNHENHDLLASYPVSQWNGGRVHFIRDSVIHLMRGEMFDIDGRSFFTMGGARSIDKAQRTEGKSWWASEIPNDSERQHAIDTLDAHGWTCDYVLTHDCPVNVMFDLGYRVGTIYETDDWKQWLQYVADNLEFSHWFFGHYHEDYKSIGIDGKFTVLYDYIYDLEAKDWSDRMRAHRINSYEQLPEPMDAKGYTIREIAEISGATVEEAERVIGDQMRGSTVSMNEDGEILIYKSDIFRVLDWL